MQGRTWDHQSPSTVDLEIRIGELLRLEACVMLQWVQAHIYRLH